VLQRAQVIAGWEDFQQCLCSCLRGLSLVLVFWSPSRFSLLDSIFFACGSVALCLCRESRSGMFCLHGPSPYSVGVDSSQDPQKLSRRELFSRLFAPVRRVVTVETSASALQQPLQTRESIPSPASSLLAVIAGRDCVAYQGTVCTLCADHCPVEGALVMAEGLPRVEPARCTGCRLCSDVCPAPTNAIHIVPRPSGLPARNETEMPNPFPDLPFEG
jgi:Pyruvate/2-oxoacid:ferredoxin oxidoreductase delta subunit